MSDENRDFGKGRDDGWNHERGSRSCTTCAFSLALVGIIAVGTVILALWLIYRPHKPQFTVVSGAVFNLNFTSPPLPLFLSATMQFTVAVRNSNRRTSFYYDRLSAFVSYRDQAITPADALQLFYQEAKSTVVLSMVLCGGGNPVPVSTEVLDGLQAAVDEVAGAAALPLRLVLAGKLRFKAGAITTGRYGLYVKCDVILVGPKKGFVSGLPLLPSPTGSCQVDV